jgi:molecular chaperone DnaK (HSP70)
MNPSVGIDLGTTNTVVGIQVDHTGPRVLEIPQPVDVRNRFELRDCIKSAVYFESADSAVVGAFAAHRIGAFKSIKSHMGLRWRMPHPHREHILVTPAYISAHILKLAHTELLRQFPEWDQSAIITVPASFNTDQRKDTLKAADMAGFMNVRLLDEPTAAFYYFFEQNRDLFRTTAEQRVLVFDFGGGTLDVSVIRVKEEGSTLLVDAFGKSRYNNLGGDDIDVDLAAFLLALWERQEGLRLEELPTTEQKSIFQLFLHRASAYKEEAEFYLSSGQPLSEFALEESISGTAKRSVQLQKRLAREHYEEITGRFFLESGDLNVFRPIGQALRIASSVLPGFKQEDVDFVLYTGGASRMLGVKAALESYFAPKQCFSITEEEACNTVALGAASCRFDEANSAGGVLMTHRLLESILTREDETGAYVPIVPLTAEASSEFKEVSHRFVLQRSAVTLTLPLFRGSDAFDNDLMPMQDLMLNLPEVVSAGATYTLSYRITDDKTIQVHARISTNSGKVISVGSELDIEQDARDVTTLRVPLARIN